MTKVDLLAGTSAPGKRALLQKLLKTRYKTENVCIVRNEEGASEEAVSDGGGRVVRTHWIAGGCLCCTGSRELERTIGDVLSGGEYERLVLVPAATADIAELLSLTEEQIRENGGTVDLVLNVVDCDSFAERLLLSEEFLKRQLKRSPFVYLYGETREKAEQTRRQIRDFCPDCVFLGEEPEKWRLSEDRVKGRKPYRDGAEESAASFLNRGRASSRYKKVPFS